MPVAQIEVGLPCVFTGNDTVDPLLAGSAFFTGFELAELQHLAHTITVLQFKEGDVIVTQGEPATFFGLVLEGALAPEVDSKLLMEAQAFTYSIS